MTQPSQSADAEAVNDCTAQQAPNTPSGSQRQEATATTAPAGRLSLPATDQATFADAGTSTAARGISTDDDLLPDARKFNSNFLNLFNIRVDDRSNIQVLV